MKPSSHIFHLHSFMANIVNTTVVGPLALLLLPLITDQRFKFVKKCSKQPLLSAKGYRTLSDNSAELFAKGRMAL